MLPSPALHLAVQDALRPPAAPAHPRPRPERRQPRPRLPEPVTIRWAGRADEPALRALAALDGAAAPSGAALLAERDGVPVAALPIDGSRAIADPFAPTGELIALLELRADQLVRAGAPRRHRLPRIARAVRRVA